MLTRTTIAKYAPYGVWAFFAFFSFRYAVEISNGGSSWKTADWLINYSAGPLRRGLTGTILLAVSDLGFPLLWLTYVFQVSIYAVIFINVLKLYKQTERGLFWLLILYSPAFLLFSFYDLQGGFRKEIIIFSVFAYFCLLYAHKTITQTKLIFVCLVYVLAGLSHELTVFTLPFFIYLLFTSAKQGLIKERVAIICSGILAVVSVAILLFATLHKGDAVVSDAICQSLINRKLNPEICLGAIRWLGEDSRKASSRVLELISYMSLFTPVLFGVAILPLFFTTWWKKQTYVLLVISALTFLPLFIVAIDWGRWVYILTFMLFCLALAERVTVKFPFKSIFVIAGIIYLTTWSIPHCCVGGIGKGFF
jgi:hypothetical protein